MKNIRKNFIARNDGFICEACGFVVPPAKGTFRNHCPKCLTSKHVDTIPGDRLNTCRGLMPPVAIEGVDPSKLDVVHECNACGKTMRNRITSDDDWQTIMLGLSLPPRLPSK